MLPKNRSEFLRGVVASLLWLMLILCFVSMVRANGMMAKNLRLIEDGAISPEQFKTELLVAETARGFVHNWATFGKDEKEYQDRLKQYGKNDSYSPGKGIQKCNSVEVLEVTQPKKNLYRVCLETNVSRVVTLPENQAYLIPKEQIIEKKQTPEGNLVSIWRDYHETVEVAIKKDKKGVVVLGYPVLISNNRLDENKVYQIMEKKSPASGFTTFARQMLDLYYRGENLSNYVQSGNKNKVKPLGGYVLKKCELLGYENRDGDMVKSLFKTTITQSMPDGNQPAVSEMEQYIFIVAEKSNGKWYLVRMGAF